MGVQRGAGSAGQIVSDAAAAMCASLGIEDTLRAIAQSAERALRADRATCFVVAGDETVSAVYTTDTDRRRRALLEATVGLGPDQVPIWHHQLLPADPLMAIEDLERDRSLPPRLVGALGGGAVIGVRLEHPSVRADGAPRLLGTLFCSYRRPRRISPGERAAARTVASVAALALANARLHDETLQSLAAASAAAEMVRHQRDYAAALVASMQDGLTVLSPEGVVTEVSPSFCRLTGFSREELVGVGHPYPYWPEAEQEALERGFARIRATGSGEWDLEFRRKSGERFPVILSGSLLQGQDGAVLGYLSTVKEVTERKRAEQELRRRAAENHALAAEQAALRRVATAVASEAEPPEVFALVAREVAGLLGADAGAVVNFAEADRGLIVGAWADGRDARPGAATVIPLGGESATGRVHRSGEAVRVDDHAGVDHETARPVVATPYRGGLAAPIRVGSLLWGAIAASTSRPDVLPVGSEQRLASFAELVGVAIANADARSRLAMQAASDPLTGLPNRRILDRRLEDAVEAAGRAGRPLSALVLDLDGFKLVNDRHGHQAGDALLRAAARCLEAGCRLGDLAGRLGGEEFLVILPDTGPKAAWLVAERMRGAIAALSLDGCPGVTASFGVASVPEHAESAGELLRAADSAMYDAKGLGRNRSVVFDCRTAAVRAEHAELAQAGQEGYLGSVLALAAAIDARDASTHAHAQTVAGYAAEIATRLGLDADRVEEVRIAGLLHDVGKVGVPDSVLHKSGPLDDAEWLEMRRHPEIGARILAHPALAAVRDWVLRHHERPDGRGYPDGLTDDAIPLEARILAVADAYEAMTADRPYRRALSREAARGELTSGRATQFDGVVVDAFLTYLHSIWAPARDLGPSWSSPVEPAGVGDPGR